MTSILKIKDVASVKPGKNYKKVENGAIPVYGSGGSFQKTDVKMEYDTPVILVGKKGTIGKAFYIERYFWASSTVFIVEPKGIYPKYLYYVLKNVDYSKLNTKGVIKELSRKSLLDLSLKVPPLVEQIDIANKIEEFEKSNGNSGIEREIKRVESLKNGMMEMIFGKLSRKN